MKVSTLGAFAAAAATAIGVSLAACGGSTTNNNAIEHSSDLGQSCLTTADCKDPAVCVGNVCVMGAGSADGGGSSGGGSSSGGSSGGSTSSSGGGSSSGGTTVPEAAPPRLSARGENCSFTADCATGLTCVPSLYTTNGVCDLASYGLSSAVTGKTCGGECSTAADCCYLPVDYFTVGTTVIHQCTDLDSIINGGTCPSTGDTTTLGQACFLKSTYCNGCGNSWACTGNQCVFQASCTQGNTGSNPGTGGCAPVSRLRHPLTTTCNSTSMTCTATATASGCTNDAACVGNPYQVFTDGIHTGTAGTCKAPGGSGGDCSCQAGTCYLACVKDLDCEIGYTCQSSTRTCVPVGACTSNTQCVTQLGNVLAVCSSGQCTTPCASDHDCSLYSGATMSVGTFNGSVCVIPSGKTTGTCQSLSNNCSQDSDCNLPTTGGGTIPQPHVFCVAPSTSTATVYYSAITN